MSEGFELVEKGYLLLDRIREFDQEVDVALKGLFERGQSWRQGGPGPAPR